MTNVIDITKGLTKEVPLKKSKFYGDLKNILNVLNIPLADPCCIDTIKAGFIVRYNQDNATGEYYDPITKTWIEFTGSSVPVTASNGIQKIGNNLSLSGRIATVGDFSTFSSDTTVINVADSVRGGYFDLYTGSQPVDGGIIFTDSLSRKWKRRIEADVVNGQWWGMKADDGTTDNTPIVNTIINYFKAQTATKTLYIPAVPFHKYYFNSTLTIDISIKLLGDNSNSDTADGYYTYLYFTNPATNGIVFRPTSTGGGTEVWMNNFTLSQGSGSHTDTVALVKATTKAHFENLDIRFAIGNGIEINASASLPTSDPNYGNASLFSIINVNTYFCQNGLYINGGDANVGKVDQFNANSCNRWSIRDNSFLGNSYNSCHSTNSGKAGDCTATYGGHVYTAINDTGSNINNRPDLSPAYWILTDDVGGAVAWNSAHSYMSGGTFLTEDVNSKNVFTGCYTESFQPPTRLNDRSIIIGGTQGAVILGGAYWNVVDGKQYIANAPVIITGSPNGDHLAVGTDHIDATVVAYFYQNTAITGTTNAAKFEGSSNQIYTNFKNSVASADFGLSNAALMTYINNSSVTSLTQGEFHPSVDNNVNLGGSSNRWKDVYAVTYHGDGSLLTGVTAGFAKQTVTLTGDGSIVIPDTCDIYKIKLLSASSGDNVAIGTTPGGIEIDDGSTALTGGVIARIKNDTAVTAGDSIYFTGITHSTTITIYKD